MSDSSPIVSVLLCNYNYGHHIGKAIESVLSQTLADFELIIIDDGSDDTSRDVISKYKDHRIKVIFHSDNQGQAAAFNTGFEHVSGRLVCLLDSDDWWLPEKLETVHRWYSFLGGNLAILQHSLEIWDNGQTRPYKNLLFSGDCIREIEEAHNIDFFVPTSGLSFPRVVLDKVFPIPREFRICADAYLMRTACVFGFLYSIPTSLGYYRQHSNAVFGNASFDANNFLRMKLFPRLNAFYAAHGKAIGLVQKEPKLLDVASKPQKGSQHSATWMDETHVACQYLSLTGDHSTMIDVGAHHGGSARPFLESGGEVYAFEPDSLNREKLMALGEDYERLHVDSRAVSDSQEKGLPFFTSSISSSISGLSSFHSTHKAHGTVDTTTIAEFCAVEKIEHVDLLKVDTEGFDLKVLHGVPWERIHPKVVVCEFEDSKSRPQGYTWTEMAQYLVDHGYQILVSEWDPSVAWGASNHWKDFSIFPCDLSDLEGRGTLIGFRDGIDRDRFDTALATYYMRCLQVQTEKTKSVAKTNSRLRKECENNQSEIEAIENSISWRVTRPVSQFLGWLRNTFRSPRSQNPK